MLKLNRLNQFYVISSRCTNKNINSSQSQFLELNEPFQYPVSDPSNLTNNFIVKKEFENKTKNV